LGRDCQLTQPYWQHDRATLYAGDALAVLADLPPASVDAVITDPPYSSGGLLRGDRAGMAATTKYTYSTTRVRYEEGNFDFTGDNRDQRGYGYWCALWLGECLRVTRPGGVCLLFADWRQLPVTTDALQAGGWVWRGIVPWVKPAARPMAGRFTGQCEYVAWGSAGPMPIDLADACLPGFYQAMPVRDREHLTQKPLSIMRELVKIVPDGGTVLDPFMGAATTGVAAVIEGRNFIGAELAPHYQRVARERVEAAIVGYRAKPYQDVLIPAEETA
jgi:site-specific DNA-methyltransferase (adenine-specific)